jgi:peptide/nickel transport system permease protein
LISLQPDAAWDAFAHLLLPSLALSLGHTMQEARITRSYMLENDGKDYITMITSQGVPRNVINRKYLLRPSIIPTVSIMGLDIAAIFGNAFLVETIFNWPGMSRYAMNAILGKDINAVCGVVLILGIIFISTNFIVDIIVMILDPRMRQSRSK